MKRSGLPPLWIIIIIVLIIVLSEIIIRILSYPGGFFFLSDVSLSLWGIVMITGGLYSLLSYFFETKWKGFQWLIWVYKTIIPAGGKVNALIFGVIGVLIGVFSLLKVIIPYFLFAPFFLSSISLDNLSISSGLVL